MTDYYLRATSQAVMNADLLAAAIINSEGHPYPGVTVAVIGNIEKDGEPIPGWHVNLRTLTELLDSQVAELPIIPPPKNPVCGWFDSLPPSWHGHEASAE